ncbi:MAG: methyltransferase domain-containing protein [Burkholderiales bacterium]
MNPAITLDHLIGARCPVCDTRIAVPFFDGGRQPLATLGWPQSAHAAQEMPRHALDFVQCPSCTHVWNRAFRYEDIPYQRNPNRMFNKGLLWQEHLAHSARALLERLPAGPTVVDIGCGEGHFVRGLANTHGPGGRFVGFDPNTSPESGAGIEFHARLFEPLRDMEGFAPDAVVMRHVLEHLTNPADFIEQLAWGAVNSPKPCWLFVECPCIDRVFETDRLADFFYEHVSHFTTDSFRRLIERGGEIDYLHHGYDGEVVYAIARLAVDPADRERAARASQFSERARASAEAIRGQLDQLARGGSLVAIWGGTGKGAAFINHFRADATRFPLVVDSDPEKVGTYVPGTGQRIEFRDALKRKPADTVIIPTQWRAKDIVKEMEREGIEVRTVLIEHGGQLVDFSTADHPYR